MSTRFTAVIPRGIVQQKLIKKVAAKYTRTLNNKTGPEAVKQAELIAKQELFWDRPPNRRNSRLHYTTGFSYRVVQGSAGGLPRLELRNRAGHAGIIEHGSGAHRIGASGRGFGKGSASRSGKNQIRFRGVPNGRGKGTTTASDAYGVGPQFRGRGVNHPGTKAFNISKRALARAVNQTLR